MKKQNDIPSLLVTHLDEDGFGITHHEGKKIVVSGALPGEEVRVKITHSGKHTSQANVIKIVTPSPARLAKPPCEKGRFCDGCPFIAMKYDAQLAWKHNLTEGEIHRYRSLADVTVHPVAPSPKPLHYRNSAKLVVAGKFAAPVIGIYRRGSHEVIDIGDCPLHHPLINRVVSAVRDGIRKGKVPIYNPKTGNGLLRYLVVRISESEGKAMAVFVTAERSFNEIHHLSKFVMKAVPEVTVAVQNINSSTGNVIFGQKDHFLTKEHNLLERIGTVKFSVSPRSFFQVNTGGAGLIYEQVRTWAELSGKEEAVDIYCGIGGISLFLAGKAGRVMGIEVVEPAVADAEENARLNRIDNCEFIAGDAAENMRELQEEGVAPDLVVLNPPRKGCDEAVLESAAKMAPAKIIYVSCSPKTLARDLDILSRLGYKCREIQPVDMFPQTPHVENVAVLMRQEGHIGAVERKEKPQQQKSGDRKPFRKRK